jgi:NADH-quinone oxidoreductase subunit C
MGSPHPRYASNDGIADAAEALLGDRLIEAREHVGELALHVERETLVETLTVLRDSLAYQQLMEIAGVDYPDRAERFEVCYHLLSVTRNHRVRVKVTTDEGNAVPTVTHLWPVAGWLEREVFDMYGVLFAGNTDLRRILTDYGFRGHPQRKDFPLTGYVELRYSEEAKRVVYEPVKLAQDFRTFDFMSPWEGAQYILPGDEKAQAAPPAAPPPPPPPVAAAKVEEVKAAPAATPTAKKAAKPKETAPAAKPKAAPKRKAAATKPAMTAEAPKPKAPRARKPAKDSGGDA